MAEEIIIDVSPEGDVQIEGKNIKGPDCLQLTKEVEQALGRVESRRKTSEFFEAPGIKRKAGA